MGSAPDLDLTVGMCYYEHALDLLEGRVTVPGIRLRWLELSVEEIFQRFMPFREWEVSEMSMAKYASLVADGDDSVVGLPVFPSRVFRHSGIYIRSDGITDPTRLAGARIGVPEWAQTACVYMRALLVEEYGVPLDSVQWFQAGVNDSGRMERVTLNLPTGVSLTSVSDRSLNSMLLAGDLDAILAAHPPAAVTAGDPRVRQLFEPASRVEADYGRRTGLVPIMHLVVVRGDVARAHPWVPGNLLGAFEEARLRSIARLRRGPAGPGSRVPLLWTHDALRRTEEIFGGEAWPYGVAANHATLDAFLRWSHEQGVTKRRLEPADLFDPSMQARHRV